MAGIAITVSAMADEGMWLLPLLKQLNGKDLKAAIRQYGYTPWHRKSFHVKELEPSLF